MINRKKYQKFLFILMFASCCVVLIITSVSISTTHWCIVRPIRLGLNNERSLAFLKSNKSIQTTIINESSNLDDYIELTSSEEQDLLMPIDLHAKLDCKRFNGKIRFGLFKGYWLLNYGLGCKNRINRVSIIDMLLNHKIFNETIWITTILCLALALFATLICSLFSFVNIFLSPNRMMNDPSNMYLWNSIAGIFHILALVTFSLEFNLFIQKNVLTADELESGWISTNKAQLSWSYYILIISTCLILLNLLLVYIVYRLKLSSSGDSSANLPNSGNNYETNMNLIIDGEKAHVANNSYVADPNLINCTYNDCKQILDANSANAPFKAKSSLKNFSQMKTTTSTRLKKVVDFIY